MTLPPVLTARALVALGYSRPTAYRMLARFRDGSDAATTAPSDAARGPRRVLAVRVAAEVTL